MKRFPDDIEKLTEQDDDFRRIYTGQNLQLVLMALQPGDEIGEEIHEDRDQFFRFETGAGEVRIDGTANRVRRTRGHRSGGGQAQRHKHGGRAHAPLHDLRPA